MTTPGVAEKFIIIGYQCEDCRTDWRSDSTGGSTCPGCFSTKTQPIYAKPKYDITLTRAEFEAVKMVVENSPCSPEGVEALSILNQAEMCK